MSRALVPLGLFLAAFLVRALPWRRVFGEERIHLFGNDAYYHMRRIVYDVVHFPRLLDFDPYFHFPEGGVPIWSPWFDGAVAMLLRLLTSGEDPESVERLAVWIPPLLGAATVLVVHRIALRHFGAGAAHAAGLLLCALSAHSWYSQIGFVDHHAAVALLSTALLGAGMDLLRRFPEPGGSRRAALAVGVLAAACVIVSPATMLHAGVVYAGLLVFLLTRRERTDACAFGGSLATALGASCLALLPFCAGRLGSLDPRVLSAFQPAAFGAAALVAGAGGILWRNEAIGRTRATRALSLLISGGAVLALAWSFSDMGAALSGAWDWFAIDSRFQAGIGEFAPLLGDEARPDFDAAELRFSYWFYVFPLCFAAMLLRARGAAELLLLGWSAVLLAATFRHLRFMNSAAPAFALVIGWGIAAAVRRASRGAPPWRRRLAAAAAAAIALALLAPSLHSYRAGLSDQLALLRGDSPRLDQRESVRRALLELGAWLKENTPTTRGWLDASERPEYGLLSSWTVGHVLRYEARRPVARDNFGTRFDLGASYFDAREPKAALLLEELGTRYVVVSPHANAEWKPARARAMFPRLYRHDGAEVENPAPHGSPSLVPALARHRLIYESETVPGFSERAAFKVFELVPGARVAGLTQPRGRVRARLPLRTNRGRELAYQATVVADEQGRYSLILPYATRGGPSATRTGSQYELSCEGDTALLEIAEVEVRDGAEIPGPDLCR